MRFSDVEAGGIFNGKHCEENCAWCFLTLPIQNNNLLVRVAKWFSFTGVVHYCFFVLCLVEI